jgi:hypothetical protein
VAIVADEFEGDVCFVIDVWKLGASARVGELGFATWSCCPGLRPPEHHQPSTSLGGRLPTPCQRAAMTAYLVRAVDVSGGTAGG